MGQSAIQTRFDGGVVSPRVSGRFDSELYKKSLRESTNFEPLPQGSLRMRSGSNKQIELTGGGNERFIKIHTSTGEDFLIEFLDNSINIYDVSSGTAVLDSITQSELVTNGDFSVAGGAGWSVVSLPAAGGSAAFVDGSSNPLGFADVFTTAGANFGIMYQKIVLPFAASVHVKFDAASTSFKDLIFKISSTNPGAWVNPGDGGDVVNVAQLSVNAGGTVPEIPFLALPVVAADNSLLATQDLGSFDVPAGTYWISFQGEQASAEDVFIDNVFVTATYAGQTSIPAPWLTNEIVEVKYATEPGRDRTVFAHSNHAPWYLLYGGIPGHWTWGNVQFVSLPLGWGDKGSVNVPAGWNWKGITTALADQNWPACVEINDGRTFYGGEPAQKNRILGSKSGSPDDFTIGTNPGDALDFKLATKGSMRWLLAHRLLLAGTDVGYNAITGSKGYPLVGDISAPSQAGAPSSDLQAALVGSTAIFASADLRRVRAVSFDFQTQGFESKDVTFAAEHITKGLIKEIHHAWTPDLTILVLLKDGTLAMCSYEPREQVTAWWVLGLAGGTILTAAVQQGTLGAYLWMAVQRGANVYLEKLSLSESDQETLTYLDGWISANSDANGTVTGLDHLEGSAVRVVSAGALVGDYLVAGGVIQLGADYANVAVYAGLPYLARAVTLPRDLKQGKGSSSKVGAILNNSAIPKINGRRAPDRTPATPMNTPEPLTTRKRTRLSRGWSDEDVVTMEQDLPFRTEICALYRSTEDGDEV